MDIYTDNVGSGCEILVVLVPDIPLTYRGKQRDIEQKLDVRAFM